MNNTYVDLASGQYNLEGPLFENFSPLKQLNKFVRVFPSNADTPARGR